ISCTPPSIRASTSDSDDAAVDRREAAPPVTPARNSRETISGAGAFHEAPAGGAGDVHRSALNPQRAVRAGDLGSESTLHQPAQSLHASAPRDVLAGHRRGGA